MIKKLPAFINLLLLAFVPIAVLVTVLVIHNGRSNKPPDKQQERIITAQTPSPRAQSDEPPLLLKSIGAKLDYYDPTTEKAGDFKFTKQKLQFNRLFMPFGFVIPADVTSTGKDKANPQPTFVLPSGTKVTSLVDGVVANMPKVWSGDYSIQVTTDGQMQEWVYETEHVINPVVKVGDRVKAGQPIAEVSDFDRSAPQGFGTVEIGILKGGNPPQHVCPFAYLDPQIKDATLTKIKAFYKSWENYRGGTTLYDENLEVPGCQTLNPIEG